MIAPWLLVKNIAFTILVPGTVTVVLPYWILTQIAVDAPRFGTLEIAGILVVLIGLAVYFRCVWSFAASGGATPAPIDAPKRLVGEGLYRYVRNPMYLGVFAVLAGEAMLFRAGSIALYALGCWGFWHTFVIVYEEPTLERDLGDAYRRYCAQVPRWWPRRTPADFRSTIE